jgi:hypothetical protein
MLRLLTMLPPLVPAFHMLRLLTMLPPGVLAFHQLNEQTRVALVASNVRGILFVDA